MKWSTQKKLHKTIVPIWIEDTALPDDLDMILQRYHSLFWHLRTSDSQFIKTLCTCLSQKTKATQEISAAHSELLLDEANSYSEEFIVAYEDFKKNRFDSAFYAFSQLAAEKTPKRS